MYSCFDPSTVYSSINVTSNRYNHYSQYRHLASTVARSVSQSRASRSSRAAGRGNFDWLEAKGQNVIHSSNEWQEVWNCCAGNKLHAIRLTVGYYKQKTCRDSVLLNRLRIGHTRLTQSFLLSGDDLPECGTCQCPLTVKHILVECVDIKDVRNKHFVASSITDLF